MADKSENKYTLKAVLLIICLIVTAFFVTDTVRTKVYSNEPLFCVKIYDYPDGYGGVYCGAGYKVIRNHSIIDSSDKYSITLLVFPEYLSF